jgi:hypothetical protein
VLSLCLVVISVCYTSITIVFLAPDLPAEHPRGLSRSHPLTVGASGRGDRELFVRRDVSSLQQPLPRRHEGFSAAKDISAPTCSSPPSNLIVRPTFFFCAKIFCCPPTRRQLDLRRQRSAAACTRTCTYLHVVSKHRMPASGHLYKT